MISLDEAVGAGSLCAAPAHCGLLFSSGSSCQAFRAKGESSGLELSCHEVDWHAEHPPITPSTLCQRVQGKGASVRMSLSTVDITLTTAILETLPDSLGQIVDGANTAAQALLDGVVNGQPVVPPEQLQQAFESVGATLPAITGMS